MAIEGHAGILVRERLVKVPGSLVGCALRIPVELPEQNAVRAVGRGRGASIGGVAWELINQALHEVPSLEQALLGILQPLVIFLLASQVVPLSLPAGLTIVRSLASSI